MSNLSWSYKKSITNSFARIQIQKAFDKKRLQRDLQKSTSASKPTTHKALCKIH